MVSRFVAAFFAVKKVGNGGDRTRIVQLTSPTPMPHSHHAGIQDYVLVQFVLQAHTLVRAIYFFESILAVRSWDPEED